MDTIYNNRIYIGKSSNNIKHYYFKSNLFFTNDFKINPFGSSKMRYQYDILFDIELLHRFSKVEKMYYYELIITKRECSERGLNAKFFWGNGWKIELELWHPIKLVKSLSINTITLLMPKKYGLYEMIGNLTYTPKIGIVIPFYSRANYVKMFLESLSLSDLRNTLIVFMDESLTKDLNNDKYDTHELIEKFKVNQPNVTIVKIYKNKHGNMYDSILHGMDLLSIFCNYLMTVDSDTIHKNDWIHKIMDTYNIVEKDYPNKPICCSGFNVVNELHSVKETKQNYIIKNSIGGCNMFFSKQTYLDYIRCTLMSHKWDTNIVHLINEKEGLLVTTKGSVINHIGKESSIDNRVETDEYDKADDF